MIDKKKIGVLAKQAGLVTEWDSGSASCVWSYGCKGVTAIDLIKFAALVADAQRDIDAKLAEETHPHDWPFIATAIRANKD